MLKKVTLILFVALAVWIAWDLLVPRRGDLRRFDAVEVGRLDAAMWRSYYERKPAKLFWQLARSVREQFGAPFWRSFPIAYRAARAAFVFKDGSSREDYAKALPYLEKFYADISSLGDEPFNVMEVSKKELEWWIIRREPEKFSTPDWERLLAEVAAGIYHVPTERFSEYARLRTEAMVLRDSKRETITEEDWAQINGLLETSWTELHQALQE
jgi:hypothetical protein